MRWRLYGDARGEIEEYSERNRENASGNEARKVTANGETGMKKEYGERTNKDTAR